MKKLVLAVFVVSLLAPAYAQVNDEALKQKAKASQDMAWSQAGVEDANSALKKLVKQDSKVGAVIASHNELVRRLNTRLDGSLDLTEQNIFFGMENLYTQVQKVEENVRPQVVAAIDHYYYSEALKEVFNLSQLVRRVEVAPYIAGVEEFYLPLRGNGQVIKSASDKKMNPVEQRVYNDLVDEHNTLLSNLRMQDPYHAYQGALTSLEDVYRAYAKLQSSKAQQAAKIFLNHEYVLAGRTYSLKGLAQEVALYWDAQNVSMDAQARAWYKAF